MRVLLDGNLPRALARQIVGHDVTTIHQRRWSDLSNGDLLDAEAGGYDVLVTLDQSLRYQQNLRGRSITVVIVRAVSNRLSDLEGLVPELLKAIAEARAGKATLVGV